MDIAVDSAHQGKRLGTMMMQRIMEDLEVEALAGAYETLMADVQSFDEKFGFKKISPTSEGTYKIV